MLTVFGNIRINSKESLQHMKDSVLSAKDISDNWIINVRGTFREEAVLFLKNHLGDSLELFCLLNDKRGWIPNALQMIDKVKYDYILIWNEDHINVADQGVYYEIVKEMQKADADYLLYSWWVFGKARKAFDVLPLQPHKHIDTFDLTKDSWSAVRKNGYPYYLLSLVGIYKKSFLISMMKRDRRKLPRSIIRYFFMIMEGLSRMNVHIDKDKWFWTLNKATGYRLRRFTKEAPFDLEKGPERTDMLPLTIALPREELFACIDDNLGTPGYSLIERNLYQKPRESVHAVQHITKILDELSTVLTKVSEDEIDNLVRELLRAKKIVVLGAGRVGLAIKGFAMRLGHLGKESHVVGETNLPSLDDRDLLIVASGSGETKSILYLAEVAKRNRVRIALITGNKNSSIGKLADTVVQIQAPSKTKSIEGFQSIQPMTTLNEQCLAIFFDALVLRLMDELNETHDTMWARHSDLE